MTGRLTPKQIDVIRSLRAAYPDASIALIGAAALDYHVPMTWRVTADIDFVVTIPISDLETVLSRLEWKKRFDHEHQWEAPNGQHVDVVPAPPDAMAKGHFVWPKSGSKMNLAGVRLALAEPPREVAPGLLLSIASVPAITVLKFAAYLDKPFERTKDLRDLAHILDAYPPDDDARFYENDIFSRELDQRQARGFILGREVGEIVDDTENAIVEQFVKRIFDGASWTTFLAESPWRMREEELVLRVDAFRAGLAEGRIVAASAPPAHAIASSGAHLTFVVIGEEITFPVDGRATLHAAVAEALARTKNTSRPPEEWQLRHENGKVIADQSLPVDACGFTPGDRLFLLLKVGAGGDVGPNR